MPSTPTNRSAAQTSEYTIKLENTPSSTFERPSTPVPHWPLPTLKHRPIPIQNIKEVRPSASKASLSGKDAQPRSPRLTSGYPSNTGHFSATPSLPPAWTVVHDKAICVLDACDYTLEGTIKKLRSAFPELAGSVLTPVMIDKRLRTLDQNPSVDFFRIGLNHVLLTCGEEDEEDTDVSGVKGRALSDRRDALSSIPSFSSVSTSRQHSAFSIGDSLKEESSKTPESVHSTASSTSKIPVAINDKSVVRSYPFGTGFMSYRTRADEEDNPRRNSSGVMEPVR